MTVTVIDNGSRDDTVACLAPWRERGVRVVAHPENLYYSRAYNLAIAASEGEIVFTVNPDTLLGPTFISAVVRVFDHAPEVGSVNGKLLLLQQDRFDPAIVAAPPPPDALIDSAGLMILPEPPPLSARQPRVGARPLPRAMRDLRCRWGMRGLSPDHAGGHRHPDGRGQGVFRQRFVMYREDVDLAWRARLFGWESRLRAGGAGLSCPQFPPRS